MNHVQLSDDVYQQARRRRAAEAGFRTVDEYVAEIVECDVMTASADFDRVFTPEILTELDQIHAEIQSGAKTYSSQDVADHFRRKSQAWRAAQDP